MRLSMLGRGGGERESGNNKLLFACKQSSHLDSKLIRADVAFRTTPTAAIAMSYWDEEEDEEENSSQLPSDYGGDDDYHMHDVLLAVSDMLDSQQRIVMVCKELLALTNIFARFSFAQ